MIVEAQSPGSGEALRALLLPKYTRTAASSRYRILQYIPHLERAGIACSVSSLFDDEYINNLYRRGQRGARSVAVAYLRRLRTLRSVRRFDVALVQHEMFPYIPWRVERAAARLIEPYVQDADDAVFHNYDTSRSRLVRRALGGKICGVVAAAAHVVAGSAYLAEYARGVNESVTLLPTVVDLDNYPPPASPAQCHGDRFTVGWIGSPTTGPQLREIEFALREFCGRRRARLVVVGSGPLDLDIPSVAFRSWSAETEVSDVSSFDVGIMPLADTPFLRGKCGFKLIQYMACGIPVIASGVGANTAIVRHGVDGLLAGSQEDWLTALEDLYADSTLREAMGRSGRARVEEQYCLQVTAPQMVSILKEAAARNGRRAH